MVNGERDHELPEVEEIGMEEKLQVSSPPGQGWWVVIGLQTVAECEVKKVLVVCWYQLLRSVWWM